MDFNIHTHSKVIHDYFFPGDQGITNETSNFIDNTNFLEILYKFLIESNKVEEEDIRQEFNFGIVEMQRVILYQINNN